MVAKWLGFKKPTFTGRYAIAGFTESKDSHGYGTKSIQFFESGVRFGCRPCDDKTLHWYYTWVPSSQGMPPFQFGLLNLFLVSCNRHV